MSNELIVRNGLIVRGDTTVQNNGVVSGSLTVVGDITGSFAYLTSSWAVTASHALSASYVIGLPATSSWAYNAKTASYVAWADVDESTTDVFSGTASYADLSKTASYIAWANVDESKTDTFAGTSSYASTAETALAVSYSNVTGITSTSTFSGTASYANTAGALVQGINVNLNQITASAIQVTNLSVVTITSSIIYSSGSNTFGDNINDIHQFTGSVSITGSLNVDDVATVKTLVVNTSGVPATVITNEITGITTPTVVDSFADTSGYAAKWFVSIRDGSNYRASEVMAAWNSAGDVTVFTEYSTVDIGNTNPLVLSATIDGSNNVTLVATPSSGNWSVRLTRILM